jgi:hypothetical protein
MENLSSLKTQLEKTESSTEQAEGQEGHGENQAKHSTHSKSSFRNVTALLHLLTPKVDPQKAN